MSEVFVYFVQAKSGGPIKIGTTGDLVGRLSSLQTANPRRLVIRAAAVGYGLWENRLHKQFRDSRIHGEWFRPTPDLLALIEDVRSWGMTPDYDPPWKIALAAKRTARAGCP